MINRRSFIRSAGLTLASGFCAGIPAMSRAQSALLDDLTIIERALALHPGLYRYQSPRQWEQRLRRFRALWTETQGLEARFLTLSQLTSTIRCAHTQCNPYNQSDDVVSRLFDRPTRLPFKFRWLNGAMVVTGDSGAVTPISVGSVVERLNGQRPVDLLRDLLVYARADGSNDRKRTALMEMRGDKEFETFDIYQGLIAPPSVAGHEVTWRDPNGCRHIASLQPVTYAARRMLFRQPNRDEPLWQWHVDAAGIAHLLMPTWVTYNGSWDWRGWLSERLASLGDARGLIIDIRDNEGGTDCGTWLLQRLLSRPFTPLRYRTRVRFRHVAGDLTPFLNTWDRSFFSLGADATADADGMLTLPPTADEDEGELRPMFPQIPIPVAILMNAQNSSATFSFVQRVKEAGVARLFGSPSGGSVRGMNGGAMFFVRLPESGLEFDLPIQGGFPERTQPDAPVWPDQLVREVAADIAAGHDPVMAAAISWLARG
jgi:hypothetical protein